MTDTQKLLREEEDQGSYRNHIYNHENQPSHIQAGNQSSYQVTQTDTGQLPPYLITLGDGAQNDPKQVDPAAVKPDPKRWYILMLFSSLGFTQGMVWNTWGPIAESSEFAFGWTDATIALMSNWGPIAYIVVTLLFAWLMDVKGLRSACLLTMLLVTIGTGLRCITSHVPAATWLIHTGQLFNGFGGPVAMGGPPVVSAVWFPVHQRTTATAIGAGINGLGVAVAYVIAPQLVPDVQNKTICMNKTLNYSSMINDTTGCIHQKDVIKQKIMLLMYIEFALSGVILLLMLIYFPSRPKNSPSITAGIQRTDFVKGVKDLARNGKFWMLAIPYSLAGGVFGGWQSVLDVILKPHNIDQDVAGWIGFYGTIAGQLSGLAVGIFADIFAKKMRLFLIVLFSCASVVFVVFALECTGIIPINIPSLYALNILGTIFLGGTGPLFFELGCESTYPVSEAVTNEGLTWLNNVVVLIFLLVLMIPWTASMYTINILGNTFLYGATPLFFELGCEVSYPVAEGITNGTMTWLNNVVGLVFLLALMIPGIGTIWMNWCLAGCIAACIPIFLFYKERYGRYDIDIIIEKEVPAEKGDADDENS